MANRPDPSGPAARGLAAVLKRRRIAVVGAGVAGITAAHLLQTAHDVVLFEKAPTLGGHANPVTVGETEIDTAFMIYNDQSYPLFLKFLGRLGLTDHSDEAEMSFSFIDHEKELRFATNKGMDALFAQRRNLLRPGFYRMFVELFRFRREAGEFLRGSDERTTLAEYFRSRGYSALFQDNLMFPLALAVWSVPTTRLRDFPARTFFRYLDHHGYLRGGGDAKWRSFRGSSAKYLRAFEASFRGEIRRNTPIERIGRLDMGVDLSFSPGSPTERYDEVVIATHADDAFRILSDPTSLEKTLLSPWRYHESDAVLHSDESVLPGDRRLWASWNIAIESASPMGLREGAVTYHLNRVQNLKCRADYFITLGDPGKIRPDRIHRRFRFKHPIFDSSSVATQSRLPELNGVRGTSFCGSYFGYGFHEDAVASAAAVGRRLGTEL